MKATDSVSKEKPLMAALASLNGEVNRQEAVRKQLIERLKPLTGATPTGPKEVEERNEMVVSSPAVRALTEEIRRLAAGHRELVHLLETMDL